MGMYEKAKELNEEFLTIFSGQCLDDASDEFKEKIIKTIEKFGRVAKFRCRSNTAYKNFITAVFENICSFEEKQITHGDRTFTVLEPKIKNMEVP